MKKAGIFAIIFLVLYALIILVSANYLANKLSPSGKTLLYFSPPVWLSLSKIFIYGVLGAIIILSIITMLHLRKSLSVLEKKEKEVIQLAKKSLR